MTRNEVVALVDEVQDFVKVVSNDEALGRMVRLGAVVSKGTDVKAVEASLELALIVTFLKEKEDGR